MARKDRACPQQGLSLPTAEELLDQIKRERQNHYETQLAEWEKEIKKWEKNGKKGSKPTRPREIEKFKLISEKELGELPKLSHLSIYTKMGNLCEIVRGGSPRPAGDERYYNGTIPFLKVADLTRKNGKFVDKAEYTIKETGLHKTRMLKKGTLVISNSGATLGVPKILAIDATANDGIAAFLGLNTERIHYFYYYWVSKTLALRSIDQGAGQPNLNTDLLKNYIVPIFSLPEQNQIVQEIETRFSICDKMEETIADALEKANALRQSILKKAFEGKLLTPEEIAQCKKEKDYEPASVLLERIQKEKS
jgi:type I restriction enzyme, S subunit